MSLKVLQAEIESKRTKNSKTFYLGGGKYRAEIGNHRHTLKSGIWIPVDTSTTLENGTDSDSGDKYFAKSKSEFLDFDIKFKEKSPLTIKIKHLPTGNAVYLKPRGDNNNPSVSVLGNKMHVVQAWDGIDVDVYIMDYGLKMTYTITSLVGQRVVEFDVNGDVSSFVVGSPWYRAASGLAVYPPTSFDGSSLTYDFRSVPVGTVIDPTLTTGTSDCTTRELRASAGSWSGARDATTANDYVLNNTEASAAFSVKDGSTYYCARMFMGFDTSSIGAGATVTDGTVNLRVTHKGAGSVTMVTHSGSNPAVANDFDLVGTSEIVTRVNVSALTLAEFNAWTLNAAGCAAVSTTGTTLIATRGGSKDFDNVAPTGYDDWCNVNGAAATASYRPYLSVTYTTPSSDQPRMGRTEHLRRLVFGPKTF